jgi:hypothetical protein
MVLSSTAFLADYGTGETRSWNVYGRAKVVRERWTPNGESTLLLAVWNSV